jgi:hypothetical protein
MAQEDVRAWEKLCELIWSCAVSEALHATVQLGIPEILEGDPKSLDEIAAATSTDPWSLESVLRTLIAFEVLENNREERYGLTGMGRLLLKSAAHSLAADAGEFFPTVYNSLGALTTAVRTGDIAFNSVYHKTFYDYLTTNETLAATFYSMMEASAPQRYKGLAAIYDFSAVSHVIDVGGGDGSLLIQLLSEHPEIKGTVFDLPHVAARASSRIEAAGLSPRCQVVSGDFRMSVPAGGDLYILAQILNNWRDEDARTILANCRAAMNYGDRLIILEPIYAHGTYSRWRALVSLGVMAQRGGRSRTEAQLRSLLRTAGFEVELIQQLPSGATSLIRATPCVHTTCTAWEKEQAHDFNYRTNL